MSVGISDGLFTGIGRLTFPLSLRVDTSPPRVRRGDSMSLTGLKTLTGLMSPPLAGASAAVCLGKWRVIAAGRAQAFPTRGPPLQEG